MIVSLEELKGYLRVDSEDDDELLTNLIKSSEELCSAILRKDILDAEDLHTVKLAMLYAATYLYEHREEANHNKLNLTLRALLFSDRSDEF